MNKLFVCEHCGNVVSMVVNKGVPVVCCGEKMKELVVKTEEGAAGHEKHLPVVSVSGNVVKVDVGSVPHPMTPEHSIQWVYLETTKGGMGKRLEGTPACTFTLTDEEPVAVYAYCNLHGLWRTDIK